MFSPSSRNIYEVHRLKPAHIEPTNQVKQNTFGLLHHSQCVTVQHFRLFWQFDTPFLNMVVAQGLTQRFMNPTHLGFVSFVFVKKKW